MSRCKSRRTWVRIHSNLERVFASGSRGRGCQLRTRRIRTKFPLVRRTTRNVPKGRIICLRNIRLASRLNRHLNFSIGNGRKANFRSGRVCCGGRTVRNRDRHQFHSDDVGVLLAHAASRRDGLVIRGAFVVWGRTMGRRGRPQRLVFQCFANDSPCRDNVTITCPPPNSPSNTRSLPSTAD